MKAYSLLRQLPSTRLLLAVTLVIGALLSRLAFSAESEPDYVEYVRSIETGTVRPTGLAFVPASNNLLLLEAGPAVGVMGARTLPTTEGAMRLTRLVTTVRAGVNVAFDVPGNRLFLYEARDPSLWVMSASTSGEPDLATLTEYEAGYLGIEDPQGMAVDPGTGDLYLLDGAGPRLARIALDPVRGPAGASVTTVPLQQEGLRGLAFHPASGHLFTVGSAAGSLYELTPEGRLWARRDLTGFDLQQPQGMVFAPSGDQTDDPAALSLYVADGGSLLRPDTRLDKHTEDGGRIVELSLTAPVQTQVTAELTLVQTIDAWRWSPPSPDSAGIAYLDHAGTLMVSDSEVNETPSHFFGYNLFESTLSGTLVSTFTTIGFSDEPTGVAYNPANGHLFISDDNGARAVYELNPGADGQYNTVDDTVTSFITSDFGSWDPEGVTYDPVANLLYVVDGVNREVYRIDPGSDGHFDGAAPAGDDLVTHFDTLILGVDDPEGIAFNRSHGTLFVVGRNDILVEVTTIGLLVQSYDISAAGLTKPAGLAYAPASQDPERYSLYVADRGVDESANPSENDGKIYEFLLSDSGTPPPAMYLPLALVNEPADPTWGTPGSTPTIAPTPTPVPLALTGMAPTSGTAGTSVPVTIRGKQFLSGASVMLENGEGPVPEIAQVGVVNGSTITALFAIKSGGPSRERVWDLRVTNPDGGTAVLPDAFTVKP